MIALYFLLFQYDFLRLRNDTIAQNPKSLLVRRSSARSVTRVYASTALTASRHPLVYHFAFTCRAQTMKCLKCGADTSVLESRLHMGVFVRRTRLCFNEHKQVTYEVPSGAVDKRQLKSALLGLAARAASDRRRRSVLRQPDVNATVLAANLGITCTRVRQIRAASAK